MPLAVDSSEKCGFIAYPYGQEKDVYAFVLLENVDESRWGSLALTYICGQHIDLSSDVKVSVQYFTAEELKALGLKLRIGWACRGCGKFKPNMKMCSKCGCTKYCCQRCQHRHWDAHREVCKDIGKSYKDCKEGLSRSRVVYFGIISAYDVGMMQHVEKHRSEANCEDPLIGLPGVTHMIRGVGA